MMRVAIIKMLTSVMLFLTVILIWYALSIPCQADDSDMMEVIVATNTESAIPTVSVYINNFEDNGLDFTSVITASCVEGTRQALEAQQRDPLPGELDHIYVQCMCASGVMF